MRHWVRGLGERVGGGGRVRRGVSRVGGRVGREGWTGGMGSGGQVNGSDDRVSRDGRV